jgi:hypothetical protein
MKIKLIGLGISLALSSSLHAFDYQISTGE